MYRFLVSVLFSLIVLSVGCGDAPEEAIKEEAIKEEAIKEEGNNPAYTYVVEKNIRELPPKIYIPSVRDFAKEINASVSLRPKGEFEKSDSYNNEMKRIWESAKLFGQPATGRFLVAPDFVPIKEMMITDEFLYDIDSEILTLQFDHQIHTGLGRQSRAWQHGVRFKLDPEIAKQVMVNASLPSDLLRAAFVISVGIDDKGEFQTPVDDFGGGPEQPYGAFFLQPTVLHECIVFRRDTGVILHKEY